MKHYKNLLTVKLKEEHINNAGKVLGKLPRKHQEKAHAKMSKFYAEAGKRGMLVLPTGAGKTYTAVHWLLKNVVAKKKKVLWLADQSFLLEQARNEFKENILLINPKLRTEINILLVSGSSRHANANQIDNRIDILLMTSQTAISNWNVSEKSEKDDDGNFIISKFKTFVENAASNEELFIVYDEAHHTPAFGRRNLLIGGSVGKTGICQKYPKTNLLGLTATPSYTDKKKRGWLWEIFEKQPIFEVSKKELEDEGILAIPDYISEKTNFNTSLLSDKEIDNIVFNHKEIPNRIIQEIAENEERNNYLAQYYLENIDKYGKTIIFVDRWYQCKTIEKYINKKAGKNIAASMFSYVDGNKNIDYINKRTKDQNDINLDKFKKGEIQVLLNVKMLTEGVDVPDVKTVFITRETNSAILFTQMIGRALRGKKAGGKKERANIVFFIDNWNRHLQFASSKVVGGLEDEFKQRGYSSMELLNIELIERLEFEYQKQEFNLSFSEMIPDGWFVVSYFDANIEKNELGEEEETITGFEENLLVFNNEKEIFDRFISNYEIKHKSDVWEKVNLHEKNEQIINGLIKEYFPNLEKINIPSTKRKLRQLARHLGQNPGQKPDYFTFEQKEETDLRKHVILVRENDFGYRKTEEYLNNIYYSNSNPFFKVLFNDFEEFYRAFRHEEDVYRRSQQEKASITEATQKIKYNRLMPQDERREHVFARDENKCLCCGKETHLQIDHILALKHNEPLNDDPEFYQTLCSTCNKEKNANEFNFRITNYKKAKIQVRDVKLSSKHELDAPIHYLNRLINCYFATNSVQKSYTKAVNNGNSIWRIKLKPSDIDISEFIQKDKNVLETIIKNRGFKLKELDIII